MSHDAPESKAKQRVPWHNDGPKTRINSMAVMIDWLTTDNNYNYWRRGDKRNGSTKLVIENAMLQMIKYKRISVKRTRKDFHDKINCLD